MMKMPVSNSMLLQAAHICMPGTPHCQSCGCCHWSSSRAHKPACLTKKNCIKGTPTVMKSCITHAAIAKTFSRAIFPLDTTTAASCPLCTAPYTMVSNGGAESLKRPLKFVRHLASSCLLQEVTLTSCTAPAQALKKRLISAWSCSCLCAGLSCAVWSLCVRQGSHNCLCLPACWPVPGHLKIIHPCLYRSACWTSLWLDQPTRVPSKNVRVQSRHLGASLRISSVFLPV